MNAKVPSEIAALRDAVGVIRRDARGVLAISGRDGRDLVQRLSTNDVKIARSGTLLGNTFTNDKGRLLGFAEHWLQEQKDLLVSWQAAELQAWLKQMTFREKLQVEALNLGQVALIGPEATRAAAPWLAGLTPGQFKSADGLWVGYHSPERIELLGEADVLAATEIQLAQLVQVGVETAEWWRVASGEPASSNEINVEHNPHEARLGPYINWKKGCYLGQEVVARLDTYQKVQRQLTRLRLTGPAPRGTALLLNGNEVGQLTSVADLAGAPYLPALAYIRTNQSAESYQLTNGQRADVVAWEAKS